MSGTLYVVGTPIGNLEDITLRALRVLREVDLIAAEDTRRTSRLLGHYAIPTPTISFHEHNSRTRKPQLLEKLRSGASIALVTDAGTPGVSDPGADLVRACVDADIPVDPVPGPSAPLTAAMASGFPLDPLTIAGFPPPRAKDRAQWLADMSRIHGAVAIFEAPHRIRDTLADAAAVLGNRQIVVGRELTKLHQEFLRGTATEIAPRLVDPRGEFTIVIAPPPDGTPHLELPSDQEVADEFGRMANIPGVSRRDAVAAVSRRYARPTREVYAAIERAKKSGE